jgi:hypothetical protein
MAGLSLMGTTSLDAASITADNHYGFYIGDAAAQNLTFIGRNEVGPGGLSGQLVNKWGFRLDQG